MGLFGLGKPNIKKMKRKRDIDGLLNLLEKDDLDSEIKTKASFAIGEIGSSKTIDSLIIIQENSDSSEARALSTISLGIIGEKVHENRVIDPLVNALTDHSLDVRLCAKRELERNKNLAEDQEKIEELIKSVETFRKGVHASQKKDWNSAISALQETVELNPNDSRARALLGMSWVESKLPGYLSSAKEQYRILNESDQEKAEMLKKYIDMAG